MEFDKEKFLATAKELGLKVEENSLNPGIFYVDEERNQKEMTLHQIFPELFGGE